MDLLQDQPSSTNHFKGFCKMLVCRLEWLTQKWKQGITECESSLFPCGLILTPHGKLRTGHQSHFCRHNYSAQSVHCAILILCSKISVKHPNALPLMDHSFLTALAAVLAQNSNVLWAVSASCLSLTGTELTIGHGQIITDPLFWARQ